MDYIEYAADSLPPLDEITQRFVRPFDLKNAPLFRVGLGEAGGRTPLTIVRYAPSYFRRGVDGDFIQEFVQLYQMETLPQLRIQYKDFSIWQNRLFQSEMIKAQESYWLTMFDGEIPLLDLPMDYGRPSMRSFSGSSVTFRADKTLLRRLHQLAAMSGTTLYMVLMAAYNVLLSKYANQSDIVVGLPIAGRIHADLDGIIGMFVNTLALRCRPEAS